MFEDYLRDLSQVQLLKKVEERELWQRYKEEGDLTARGKLIEAYQPLVFKTVMKLRPRQDWLLDLIQEATIGLIEAVERYDPNRGIAFPTFATFRIRGQMINHLQKHREDVLSLEHTASGPDEEVQNLYEMISDEGMDLEETALKKLMIQEPMTHALSLLPEKERHILRAVFIEDQQPQKVADELQISLPHLYRLQKKGLRKIKGYLSNQRLES